MKNLNNEEQYQNPSQAINESQETRLGEIYYSSQKKLQRKLRIFISSA